MAYAGTTASSSLANPPLRIAGYTGAGANSTAFGVAAGLGAKNVWLYNTSHATSDMAASNFFTDAYYMGMKQGDLIMGVICTGSSAYPYIGTLGAITTSGGALSSTGATLWSTR